MVNERGETMSKSIANEEQRSVERIALHHYCVKSLEVSINAHALYGPPHTHTSPLILLITTASTPAVLAPESC